MQRKLYKKEERGLKGGPNHQVSEMMGSVTTTGYWPDSPDRNNDFNIIPSNEITMEGMDIPLMGIDNLGNMQHMTPGQDYTFPGNYVIEIPYLRNDAGFDAKPIHKGSPVAWPTDKIDNNIKARRYANPMYFNQGGIYLGAYKQVGGQLVPHDTNMSSFQKGGEPIYVESEDDPRYKNYKELSELYTRSKKALKKYSPNLSYHVNDALKYDMIKKDSKGYYVDSPYYNPGQKQYLGMLGNTELEFLKPGTELNKIYTDAFTRNVKPIGFRNRDFAFPIYEEPGPEVIVSAKPKAIDIKPLPIQQVDLKSGLTRLPIPQTNKQRVVVNTPQGDKIRVQDAKTKRFINWEDEKGLPSDIENPSGTASQDFPEMRRVAVPPGGFAYGGDISIPNLSRQDGGEMPFGLPLKEQNIYTLPEYIQPINPKTGEILPDPRRPDLGMGTKASEFKYTYGTDEGDIDIPSIVAGQYIGDQALDRYRLTGERFKTMTDPGSYSNFYMQMRDLGLMQEKHGGAVKKVKIKSIPKNWKSQ